MIVILNMELESFRGAPVVVRSPDQNSLMNVAPAVSRRDSAKSLGIGSGARLGVLAETGK